MIVVEGVDGSGKTTLCEHLAKQFDLEIKDWGVPRDQLPNVGVKRRVYESLAIAVRGSASDPVLIHDRLWFSELVYGGVLRGEHAFANKREFRLVWDLWVALRPVTVFCIPPLDTIVANVAESVQLEGVREQIEPLFERYLHYRARLRQHPDFVMSYDYTGQWPSSKLSKIEKTVDKYLDRREQRRWGTR